MTEDHCTTERCVCNATGCPYVCGGPTIVSTWPNESRMSEDERAIYAAGLWRDREAILAYAKARGCSAWEVARLIVRFRDLDREASVSFERLSVSFAIVRTRNGIASNQPVQVSNSYEALRNRLANRPHPSWTRAWKDRLARPGQLRDARQVRRPPQPWARCAL